MQLTFLRKYFFSLLSVFILIFVALHGNASENMILFDGKPYTFRPLELPTCGDLNSPQHTAAIFAINFAQSNGESVWASACKAGIQTKCTPEDIKRFGVQMVFSLMRKYESGLDNAACKQIRKDCEDRCMASKLFDDRACLIECNQYETWKRQ